MGAEGPGTLRLDSGVRLLRRGGASLGALQHQHRGSRQALLSGAAEPRRRGAGGGVSVACERQQDSGGRVRHALGSRVSDALCRDHHGEQRAFLQLQGHQHAPVRAVRGDPADRPRICSHLFRSPDRAVSSVRGLWAIGIRALALEEAQAPAPAADPVAVARKTRYIRPHATRHPSVEAPLRQSASCRPAAAPRAHIIPLSIRQYPVAAQAGAADVFENLSWSGTMKDKLIIFDTTMRDGEQSPGASMTKEEKLRIARLLEKMRVDVIAAGFPASSNGDFEAVQAVAGVIKDSTVAGLCRANDRDIQRGIDALKKAKSGRIHIFIATSALHMEKKLRMTPEQVLEQATLSVRFARKHRDDIEFSPEDGSRSDPNFLCRVLEAVIKEGASTINIPDTVGYAVPEQFGEFIRKLREKVPNSDRAVWSVHCHNDLGMAVANSLAAVTIGGARQIECTVNGL